MRRPNRRTLPMVIGVAVVSTLAANTAVLLAQHTESGTSPKDTVAPPQSARLVAAADASTVTPQAVAPLTRQVDATVLISGATTLPAALIDKIRKVKGVHNVESIDAVQTKVDGKNIGLIGVDPSTFRAYTPKPTAKSDSLWRNIASGDIAVSFSLSTDGDIPLASRVTIAGRTHQVSARVGALATMGMSDFDGVVSHQTATALGMPSGNGLIVSAPKDDADKLIKKLRKSVLPKKGYHVVSLHPTLNYLSPNGKVVQLPTADGTYMTGRQIITAIRAAETKIGLPYIWGGTGPRGYDCSGLVQYALAVAGIKMPRVAADQARTGPIVPYSQAQVGDLLVWANDPTNPGYIDHIAIYLGDGKMVVAPHTGTNVQIESVYTSTLVGAVRVNPALASRVATGG